MRRFVATMLALLLVALPLPANQPVKQQQSQAPIVQVEAHYKMVAPGMGLTSLEGGIDEDSVRETIVSIVEAANEGAQVIVLVINSPGGSYSAGFLLSQFLEQFPVPVACVVDGMAASMAAYVLQSCDARVMTKRSVIMMHEPGMLMAGQERELRNGANSLRAITQAMVEQLAMRTKVSPEYVLSKIEGGKEWWVSWREADQIGLVDGVFGSVKELLALLAGMRPASPAAP